MDLREFQNIARRRGHFTDNHDNACATWAKGWGLGYFWRERWAYKEYTVGTLTYRTGRVLCRHGSYVVTECTIDGQEVTPYRFKKALTSFVAPELTADELQYINDEKKRLEAVYMARAARSRRTHSRHSSPATDARQLLLDFDAA